MKIGDRVMTPHGPGVIVGKDMPESRAWRWKVRLDERQRERVDLEGVLCYFPHELEEVDDE